MFPQNQLSACTKALESSEELLEVANQTLCSSANQDGFTQVHAHSEYVGISTETNRMPRVLHNTLCIYFKSNTRGSFLLRCCSNMGACMGNELRFHYMSNVCIVWGTHPKAGSLLVPEKALKEFLSARSKSGNITLKIL